MRKASPVLLAFLLVTCHWPMIPPKAVQPAECFCSPPADRHGWTQTSGLEMSE